jgi:Predicted Zn-dependent hydrolases of the beta-lactamase fold
MKFKILSHAGMMVEDKGKTLLFDPWLIGSCYWRSWWNFPEIERSEINQIKPDYIYLTHLHWDHFHAPSMRLFGRDVTYIVPKIPGTRMVRDLRSCKFHNIVEIPHGGKFELWENCFLHSFQFGVFAADSVAVVSDGKTTLLNANDCKTFGLPLKQITNRFPKVDFCFRSHSSAKPIPYTIKGYKEKFADFRTTQDYIEEFTNFSMAVGARYAIPFASNHCFLHRETVKYNDTGVNPQMVADYYNSHTQAKARNSECVIMVPGSSWSNKEGFDLREFDYGKKAEIIAAMQEKYAEKLAAQYEKEEKTKASFKAFKRYFTNFFDSTPALIRKKLLPGKLLFRVTDADGEHCWLLEAASKKIEEVGPETEADVTIRVPAIVINDCVRRKMFSVWSASKRLEIDLKSEDMLGRLQGLLGLLDFYENEGLPLRNNFSRRDFPIWLRRWREAAEAVRLFFVYKVFRKKFVISELYLKPQENKLT